MSLLPINSFVCAQAFHWAHPNYDGAMKEIARVLKPDGTAFFIWNMEDRSFITLHMSMATADGCVENRPSGWQRFENSTRVMKVVPHSFV